MERPGYRIQTRALTEGAVMAALTAVLAIVYLYIPVLGVLVSFIWTLPVIAVCVRHGLRIGTLTMVAASLVVMMIATPLAALSLIVPFAAPALLLGYALRSNWQTAPTLISTSFATLVSMLGALVLAFFITGISPWQQWLTLRDSLLSSVELMIPMYESSGALARMGLTPEAFLAQWQGSMMLMELLLPALLMVSAVLSALVNYVLAHKILTKLKIQLPPAQPFRMWRLPWWTIWGFILAFAWTFVGNRFLYQQPLIGTIGMNILFIFVPLLVMQGLSVLAYLMHGVSRQRRMFYKVVLLVGIFFLLNGFVLVMGVIGLFDLVFDYRRLEKLPKE